MNSFSKYYLVLSVSIILSLCCKDVNGQSKPDSLKAALTIAKEDTVRLNLLCRLSSFYRNAGDYGQALEYAFNAKELAKRNFKSSRSDQLTTAKTRAYLANALTCIGNVFVSKGNYPEALNNFYASLKIYEELKDKKGIAISYNSVGIILASQLNYKESL